MRTLIAETLAIAPFDKFLFPSDGFGLAEHYHLGALLFRRGLSDFLSAGITANSWTHADAERISGLVVFQNTRRVYQLGNATSP